MRNRLAKIAALREEMLGMGLLKVVAAQFVAGIWAAMANTGTRLR